MPVLNQHEHYRYLGVPIGMMRDIDSLDHLVDDLCQDLERINSSLLSPWQKLDAIRTFVQPSLTFALRAGEPEKASLIKYCQKLIEIVRNICNLPTRASQSIIFASTKVGGLALQDPLVEVDIQTTAQAIKMLSSNDPLVSTIAKSELKQSVRFAARADPSPALIRDFLSGSTKGAFHPDLIRYRTHSLWTRAHKACRNLKISFQVPDFNSPFSTMALQFLPSWPVPNSTSFAKIALLKNSYHFLIKVKWLVPLLKTILEIDHRGYTLALISILKIGNVFTVLVLT